MYAHTNLVARDWKKVAQFYERVFGCVPVPPVRDLSGEWLDRATGIKSAHIRWIHLRLPGGSPGNNTADAVPGTNNTGHSNAPTLEIFQYEIFKGGGLRVGGERGHSPDDPGFGHIAFAVDDVEATVDSVFKNGGSEVGERTIREIPGTGIIDFQYVRDPEGNIIEVQKWVNKNK